MPAPVTIEGWAQGLNTILRPESMPTDALRRAVNVDIDDVGKLSLRQGRSRIYTGTIQKGSFWSGSKYTFFVEAGSLKRLLRKVDDTIGAQVIRTGMGAYPVHFLELNDRIYYTNGIVTGVLTDDLEDLPWGLAAPGTQPNVAQGNGQLYAGTYQVAVTFLTSSGEESGTPLSAEIELTTDDSSIVLTDFPPAPPGADRIRIYCSHRNGDGMYRIAEVAPTTLSYQIAVVSNAVSVRLQTQFAIPPPAGDLIEYHKGRIYIARGNIVWFTMALRYNLVMPMKGFLLYPERVTVLKAVDDGIYICADKTYYVSGVDTPSFRQRDVLPYGGVYDTGLKIPNFDAVAWFSKRGLVFGGEGGEVLNVMQDRVAVSEYGSGTMMWREHKGLRQFVANLWDGDLTNYAAPDYVALETLRAGDFI